MQMEKSRFNEVMTEKRELRKRKLETDSDDEHSSKRAKTTHASLMLPPLQFDELGQLMHSKAHSDVLFGYELMPAAIADPLADRSSFTDDLDSERPFGLRHRRQDAKAPVAPQRQDRQQGGEPSVPAPQSQDGQPLVHAPQKQDTQDSEPPAPVPQSQQPGVKGGRQAPLNEEEKRKYLQRMATNRAVKELKKCVEQQGRSVLTLFVNKNKHVVFDQHVEDGSIYLTPNRINQLIDLVKSFREPPPSSIGGGSDDTTDGPSKMTIHTSIKKFRILMGQLYEGKRRGFNDPAKRPVDFPEDCWANPDTIKGRENHSKMLAWVQEKLDLGMTAKDLVLVGDEPKTGAGGAGSGSGSGSGASGRQYKTSQAAKADVELSGNTELVKKKTKPRRDQDDEDYDPSRGV